jgi:hypothetical protein
VKKEKKENKTSKKEWKKTKRNKKKNQTKGKSWTKEITPITCVFLVSNVYVVCDWVY